MLLRRYANVGIFEVIANTIVLKLIIAACYHSLINCVQKERTDQTCMILSAIGIVNNGQ
jgi:hypothetical protein